MSVDILRISGLESPGQTVAAPPTGRLAPSPTGSLHLGNVRTFLWAWLSVRKNRGRVILRVEDLEKQAAPGVLEEMLSDLAWLGFDWDEGPVWDEAQEKLFRQTGRVELIEQGGRGPYVQSLRRDFYTLKFAALQTSNAIYPCVCSRREILSAMTAPHEGERELRYPGTCRDRFGSIEEAAAAAGKSRVPVLRFKVPAGKISFDDLFRGSQTVDVESDCGDFVAFKSPGQPSYQVAVAVDDIAMGVTEVVRGDDLIPSTGRQILVYREFGSEPPRYGHVPLVVGPDGKRLAKRHGDFRIATFRRRSADPSRLIGFLARTSGIECPDRCSLAELVPRWDPARLRPDRVILTEETLGAIG